VTDTINSNTVAGLLAFCDFTIEKGYGPSSAVEPLKSAVRRVFSAVEGEAYERFGLANLDPDEYMDRFDTMVRGEFKHESLVAYRRRVKRAVAAYEEFLADGKPPSFGGGQQRVTRSKEAPKKANGQKSGSDELPLPPPGANMISFPFPLENGELAHLHLPRRLRKSDADRLSAFLRTLQTEELGQIPEKAGAALAA